MQRRDFYRLNKVAPLHLLLACGVVAVAAHFLSIWLSFGSPYLGIEWQLRNQSPGLIVNQVSGPSKGKLVPGDIIVEFAGENDERFVLHHQSLIEDPDFAPTYAVFNQFFADQALLYKLLSQTSITAILDDGRRIDLQPTTRSYILQLPINFWLLQLFGISALLIGVGVWCFRRDDLAAKIFALCGLGNMVGALCASIYTSRELVMNPDLFYALAMTNHLGNMLLSYSLMALLWHYPQGLGNRSIVWFVYPLVPIFWFNELWQFVELPFHAFYLQYNFPFIFGMLFAGIQWRISKRKPLERAALKWFLLSIVICVSLTVFIFVTPVVFHSAPLVSLVAANGIIFIMFVSLALGVSRYRLFQLERWWLATWTWFFGGLLLIFFDLALLYTLNLSPHITLGLAILLGGWVYFPIRQWVWVKIVRSPKQLLEQYLPDLMNMFIVSTSVKELANQWRIMLTRIFDPLHIIEQNVKLDRAQITDNGLFLLVPTVCGQGSIKLSCSNRGGRLFSPDDISLVDAILGLAKKSASVHEAQEKGASLERNRIMRDLHDDVGAKLLTLFHKAQTRENAQVAQSALQSLRDTIFCLREQNSVPIEDALADWHAELRDRVESAGIRLNWQQEESFSNIMLSARQYSDLGRIVNEIVSNALRHAGADLINISIKTGDAFQIRIADNGTGKDISDWIEGTGMQNIRIRVNEMDGQVEWRSKKSPNDPAESGTMVEISLPWLGHAK